MEPLPLLFSFMFFFAFAVYLFFGIFVLKSNPKSELHRWFFAVTASLCFWSLSFSLANSAPDLETCLLWRRFSALGWGTVYSFLLHFLLLLSDNSLAKRLKKWLFLLHVPAAITVYVFSLSTRITTVQYNLVKLDLGWINVAIQNGWTQFFHTYYGSYAVFCLLVLWSWYRRAEIESEKKSASLILKSLLATFFLGALFDLILSARLATPLPQMGPLFTLLPVLAIWYSTIRYGLMPGAHERETQAQILTDRVMVKLHYYVAILYLSAGLLAFGARFFPTMVHSAASLKLMTSAGIIFFLSGLVLLVVQLVPHTVFKYSVTGFFILGSIPFATLLFVRYSAVTIWAFPLVLMMVSLLFNTKIPLLMVTITAVATQFLVWIYAPSTPITMDPFDHLVRIAFFVLTYWLGTMVNGTYIKRLEDNVFQLEFQKIVSEVSHDFVTVNDSNLNDKMNSVLCRAGEFFQVDRAFLLLVNRDAGTFSYTHEWLNEGVNSEAYRLQSVPLDVFPWWANEVREHGVLWLRDTEQLPEDASRERSVLTVMNVKSLLALPIQGRNELLGFIGLVSLKEVNPWSKDHLELLRTLSNLLADGLMHVQADREIEYMAYYDMLTGLPNRFLFADRLTQAIHLARRTEKFIGVMFLDLDSFKTINDTLGFQGGDSIIKSFAENLEGRLRRTDTVARFGGDEFLILINNVADLKHVIRVADNIQHFFREPLYHNGQEIFLTGSGGLAIYPLDGEGPDSLIKNAEVAMNRAKARGKNQYVLCTEDMKEDVRRNMALSNSLYRAQEREELLLHYQPQVDLRSGKIVAVEALLRWNHPELGPIPPGVFIPLAEKSGLIRSIGQWVLETATEQVRQWQEKGMADLRVAVNLSFGQFANHLFVQDVGSLLEKTGLAPGCLELEITESLATQEATRTTDILNELKGLGVSIAIDDFGTEYSSLSRLKMLPVDRVKIDMQFVHGIERSEKDRAIIRVIITLAKSLGLEVVAEGVETGEQLEFLHREMCDYVQGFHYYRPMPAEKFEQLLRTVES